LTPGWDEKIWTYLNRTGWRHDPHFPVQCIQYNVSHGKLNRGLMVPHTFRLLTEASQQTEDDLKRANILGWCVELVSELDIVTWFEPFLKI
jgi:hypothetical protein